MTRGAYFVSTGELPAFLKKVDADYQVIISPAQWLEPNIGNGIWAVLQWLIVLQ